MQLHNLPIACMNKKIGSQIGETLGGLKAWDVDVDVDGSSWGLALRLCIKMDLQKPLARGCTINVRGNHLWVLLTYEKLPKLYFKCGKISHGQGKCDVEAGNMSVAKGQYGLWL